MTKGVSEDRAALSERTQEVTALRETVAALRRSIELNDEERRAYVTNHDKLVRSLGERVSDAQARYDRAQLDFATRLRQATAGADTRIEELERDLAKARSAAGSVAGAPTTTKKGLPGHGGRKKK